MGNNIREQRAVGTLIVRGLTFEVTRTLWTNSDGASYDVAENVSGFSLNNESWDSMPDEGDLAAVISDLESDGADRDPLFHDKAEVAAFLARLEPEK